MSVKEKPKMSFPKDSPLRYSQENEQINDHSAQEAEERDIETNQSQYGQMHDKSAVTFYLWLTDSSS